MYTICRGGSELFSRSVWIALQQDYFIHLFGAQRQAHQEGGAFAHFRLEGERAAVIVHDNGARQRQSLAGAAADFFCREKRIEQFVADVFR